MSTNGYFLQYLQLRFRSRRDIVISNPEYSSTPRAAVAESPQISLRWFWKHQCHPGGRRNLEGGAANGSSSPWLSVNAEENCISPTPTHRHHGKRSRAELRRDTTGNDIFQQLHAQILAFAEQIGVEAEGCWRISTTAVWKLEGKHCSFLEQVKKLVISQMHNSCFDKALQG